VEEHWKDVWRVGDMVFKVGGIFGGAGYIKCNNCKSKADADNFCIATGVEMTKIVVTPEALKDSDELDQRYADHLKFLWEQYNKLMGIGFIVSAATLGFLLQGIIFNKDARALLQNSPLNTSWLFSAIFTAGTAALLFIAARWCSQILMERQVYGRYSDAVKYFKTTLENETVWPTAIQPKPYMWWINRECLLKFVGWLNEFAKLVGIVLILISWFSCFKFAWPLIDNLTVVKP
jgi:hypothetical protein